MTGKWIVLLHHKPIPDEVDDPWLSQMRFDEPDPELDFFSQRKEEEREDARFHHILEEYHKTPVSAWRANMYGITGRASRQPGVQCDWSKTAQGQTRITCATEEQARRIAEIAPDLYGIRAEVFFD